MPLSFSVILSLRPTSPPPVLSVLSRLVSGSQWDCHGGTWDMARASWKWEICLLWGRYGLQHIGCLSHGSTLLLAIYPAPSLSIPLSGCCTTLEPTMETPQTPSLTDEERKRRVIKKDTEKERAKEGGLIWKGCLLVTTETLPARTEAFTENTMSQLDVSILYALTHLLIHAHHTTINPAMLVNCALHAWIQTSTGPVVQCEALLYVYRKVALHIPHVNNSHHQFSVS